MIADIALVAWGVVNGFLAGNYGWWWYGWTDRRKKGGAPPRLQVIFYFSCVVPLFSSSAVGEFIVANLEMVACEGGKQGVGWARQRNGDEECCSGFGFWSCREWVWHVIQEDQFSGLSDPSPKKSPFSLFG